MPRIYWREEIKPNSNLLKLPSFQRVAHVEEEGGKVLREVWEMQDGSLLRRSVERSLNESPGSLRAAGDESVNALPDVGEDEVRQWRPSTEEAFNALWLKARFRED